MGKKELRMSQISIWQKYAPLLPQERERLEQAFFALFPIVHFCHHPGSRATFPEECTDKHHPLGSYSWGCRCCQTRRFRNIFGRYIDFLCEDMHIPTELTGTKIKNRGYRFFKRKQCLYFSIRRHPVLDYESYLETEQRWRFDTQGKKFTLLTEKTIGEYYKESYKV
jgi:hypothetical protein